MLALLLSFFSILGCNEMTHQLCTSERLSDFPALEQPHRISLYDAKTFQMIDLVSKNVRKSKGVYAAGSEADAPQIFTCEIAGRRIVESYSSKFKTWSFQVLEPSANGYDTAWLAFDRSDLDRAQVPYEIIEDVGSRLTDWLSPEWAERLGLGARIFDEDEKSYRMIIQTKNLKDPAVLIKLGKTTAARLRAIK